MWLRIQRAESFRASPPTTAAPYAPRRPPNPRGVGPTFAGGKASAGADVERERLSIRVAAELEGLVGRECAGGCESVNRVPSNVQREIR